MRDAVKLSGKNVLIEGTKYKLDSFYYMEAFSQVYVKLISDKDQYLNLKLEEFTKHLIDGNKQINSNSN